MGGECVPNGGRWEVGVTDVELTDIGKTIFRTDKSIIVSLIAMSLHASVDLPCRESSASRKCTATTSRMCHHPSNFLDHPQFALCKV